MEENKSLEVFAKAPIRKAVLQNALPAMAAMLMVLVYNLADTFFIGQTHDDLQVAAVSLATPVFLLFMSVGTVFGIGGTSVISRALGEGRNWLGAGCPAAAGLLRRCKELAAVQERPAVFAAICVCTERGADGALLSVHRSDRQCLPHGHRCV